MPARAVVANVTVTVAIAVRTLHASAAGVTVGAARIGAVVIIDAFDAAAEGAVRLVWIIAVPAIDTLYADGRFEAGAT